MQLYHFQKPEDHKAETMKQSPELRHKNVDESRMTLI